MQPVDLALLGGLALPLVAAHNLADHPLQPSTWAAAKSRCDHEGRLACAKHTGVVVLLQALAVLAVVGLTETAVSPLAASALIISATGLLLAVLASAATILMVSAILASRHGRRALDQQTY